MLQNNRVRWPRSSPGSLHRTRRPVECILLIDSHVYYLSHDFGIQHLLIRFTLHYLIDSRRASQLYLRRDPYRSLTPFISFCVHHITAVERQNQVSRIFTKIQLSSLPNSLGQSSTHRLKNFSNVQIFHIVIIKSKYGKTQLVTYFTKMLQQKPSKPNTL